MWSQNLFKFQLQVQIKSKILTGCKSYVFTLNMMMINGRKWNNN